MEERRLPHLPCRYQTRAQPQLHGFKSPERLLYFWDTSRGEVVAMWLAAMWLVPMFGVHVC